MSIVLGALVVVLLAALVHVAWRYLELRRRYRPIIDVDREIAVRRAAIEREAEEHAKRLGSMRREAEASIASGRAELERELTSRRAQLQEELAKVGSELEGLRGHQRVLQSDYATAKAIYDRLSSEVDLLEENLEDIAVGLYKPHYDYDSSEKYRAELDRIRAAQKTMVRGEAAVSFVHEWFVNNSKSEGRKMQKQQAKLMLRAFNGEVEAAIGKVTWNNATKMEERIRKALDQINQQGTVMHVSITTGYLKLALAELRLEHELEEKRREELEEQRRIKEQIREEERALREAQRAQDEAEAEELRFEKALAKARAEAAMAHGAQVGRLDEKVRELEAALEDAHRKKERALSLAQQTKSGHVYIVSNVGSFGDGVFKIGMTRRLEPRDRVKELGDASVPFEFDVHAMVYSADAPGLENAFHRHFAQRRVNLINPRKEFFSVTIAELEQFTRQRGLEIEITKLAEAREYRETMALRVDSHANGTARPPSLAFPEALLPSVPSP